MERLLPYVVDWFGNRREHLDVFACSDCRLEGWFKGELLVLFTRLQQQGVVKGFEREAKVATASGRVQVDFRLYLGDQAHLCELKALCTSQAAGTPRNLSFYFRDDDLGLFKDFRKLDSIDAPHKWLIAFVYPCPEIAVWDRALSLCPTGLAHWRAINRPTGGSPCLFVSLWQAQSACIETERLTG